MFLRIAVLKKGKSTLLYLAQTTGQEALSIPYIGFSLHQVLVAIETGISFNKFMKVYMQLQYIY